MTNDEIIEAMAKAGNAVGIEHGAIPYADLDEIDRAYCLAVHKAAFEVAYRSLVNRMCSIENSSDQLQRSFP